MIGEFGGDRFFFWFSRIWVRYSVRRELFFCGFCDSFLRLLRNLFNFVSGEIGVLNWECFILFNGVSFGR